MNQDNYFSETTPTNSHPSAKQCDYLGGGAFLNLCLEFLTFLNLERRKCSYIVLVENLPFKAKTTYMNSTINIFNIY